jgi:methionyl-tRNA formyltransferase
MNKFVIASSKDWNKVLVEKLSTRVNGEFIWISSKDELNINFLDSIQPEYIFFPHWSDIIPSDIFMNFECVIFHMTDVPFGRGGSPLQNLIARGIYETQISALRCVKEIDGGPVYLKRSLSLYGSAEEIYLRATKVIEEMIVDIVLTSPKAQEQSGEIVEFKRRKPAEGNIGIVDNIEKMFDMIRMLDADGYPHAFIETENFRFEFTRASLKSSGIIADVHITRK